MTPPLDPPARPQDDEDLSRLAPASAIAPEKLTNATNLGVSSQDHGKICPQDGGVCWEPGCSVAYCEAVRERDEARKVVRDTLWMAGRYADGRRSYAVGLYNDALAIALEGGYAEGAQPARDGMFDQIETGSVSSQEQAVELGAQRKNTDSHSADPPARRDEDTPKI